MVDNLDIHTNFLGTKPIPKELSSDEYAFMQYVFPNNRILSRDSTFNMVDLFLSFWWELKLIKINPSPYQN